MFYLFLFDLSGVKEEKRHQRRGAANQQAEGNDANPAGKGVCYSQKTSRGMETRLQTSKLIFMYFFSSLLTSRCLQLDVELQSMIGLLKAILKERPAQITRELPAVLQVLLPLLPSPLAAPRIQQLFLDIGVCLMPSHLHHLGTWPA